MSSLLSFPKLRRMHDAMLSQYQDDRKQKIGEVEHRFPKALGLSAAQLFGIGGCKRSQSLMYAAIWALARHEHIHMPVEHIAAFLNLSEEKVLYCLASAEAAMISGADNPTRADMLVCFEALGPSVSKILRII